MKTISKKSIVNFVFCAVLITVSTAATAKAQATLSFSDDIGEIELLTYSFETIADSSWAKGGGVSVGKPTFGPLKFTAARDSSTLKMLGLISTGKNAESATLTVIPARSSDSLSYTFTGIFFTSVSQSEVSEKTRFQIGGAFVYKTVSIRSSTNGTLSCIAIDVPAGTVNNGC
jgi:type VI protein secretion system component Hcp